MFVCICGRWASFRVVVVCVGMGDFVFLYMCFVSVVVEALVLVVCLLFDLVFCSF